MRVQKTPFACRTALALLLAAGSLRAATISQPIAYRSPRDAVGFWQGAVPELQDFEAPDGPWETGFTLDCGLRWAPGLRSLDGVLIVDSVDADDGLIDGSGTMGASWSCPASSLTIQFDHPVTQAGFVWTDSDRALSNVNIQVLGSDMRSQLAEMNAGDLADDYSTGTTAEDRFFGVKADEGIGAIRISIDKGTGIEIDHVAMLVPEPSASLLAIIGALAFVCPRLGSMRDTRALTKKGEDADRPRLHP